MNKEKVKISVITAFYNGNKYMEDYWACIGQVCSVTDCGIEVLLVNDSPGVEILMSPPPCDNLSVRVLTNSVNVGIHQSRIYGLEEAQGEFVLILDQDDRIEKNFFTSQLTAIKNADVSVANGYDEFSFRKGLLYENRFSGELAIQERMHLRVRNMIISPGQCLIRKSAIPQEWKEYVLKNNGVDDALLWFLMFEKKNKFVYNHEALFTHCYTGENISGTIEKMRAPHDELVDCMLEMKNYSKKKAQLYQKTVHYKFAIKRGKRVLLTESAKHPVLFFDNLMYKLCFRGITANRENLQ